MKLLISAAALLQSTYQQTIVHGPTDQDWNYLKHGQDWKSKVWEDADGNDVNQCEGGAKGPQSPIDFVTHGQDGFVAEYDEPLESDHDMFSFDFQNLVAKVGWSYGCGMFGFSMRESCFGNVGGDCQAPVIPPEEPAEDAGPPAEDPPAGDPPADAVPESEGGRRRLDGHADQMQDKSSSSSVMNSILAEREYLTTQEFFSTRVEFHSPSEHTMDGQRYDLEMQISLVNNPYKYQAAASVDAEGNVDPGITGAKVSVLFDVLNATIRHNSEEQSIVDSFFSSLYLDSRNFEEGQDKYSRVAFKPMMELLNFNDRYMYLGSDTTPPCKGGKLWNVLATVYPVRQDTVDAFTAILKSAGDYYAAGTYDGDDEALWQVGNYRETQTTTGVDHKVKYVKTSAGAGHDDEGFGPTVIFLGILTTLLVIITIYCIMKYNKREGAKYHAEQEAKKAEGQ